MPHECTTCGRTFPDGSKEMLSGCPDCGGNKFQFHPGASGSDPSERPTPPGSDTPSESTADHEPPPPASDTSGSPESEPGTPRDTGPETRPTPTSTESSFTFGSRRSEDRSADSDSGPGEADRSDRGSGDDPDSEPVDGDPPPEDHAQASARSTVVSEDELPASDADQDAPVGTVDGEGRTADADGEAPVGRQAGSEPADISELRDELNDQFESIKIHARGEYELNLMELYDREEHIIALQEDGRYVIDVPSSWRRSDEDT